MLLMHVDSLEFNKTSVILLPLYNTVKKPVKDNRGSYWKQGVFVSGT